MTGRSLRDRAAGAAPGLEPARVETLALATRDRPRLACASIRAHLENARDHGRRVTLLVFEDSDEEQPAAALDRALDEVRREFSAPIRVVDRRVRARLAEDLARDLRGTLAPEAIRFAILGEALQGYAVGAARNCMLLWSAGRPLVCFDDDTFPPAAPAIGSRPGLVLDAAHDPTELHFFPGRSEAFAAAPRESVDVIGLHEQLLGRSVAACVADLPEGVSIETPDDPRRWQDPSARVVATMLGLAGDSGMAEPVYYFLLGGASRERFVRAHAAFGITREVLRAVTTPTVCGSPFFMATHAGLDTRAPLVPFFSAGRGEETPFAIALRIVAPADYIGHLPWVVRHDPPEIRRAQLDGVLRALGRPHTATLVCMCMAAFRPVPGSPADRLDRLGRFLRTLGEAPAAEVRALLRTEAERLQRSRIARFERSRAEADRTHFAWVADLDRCRVAAESALADPAYPIACDQDPECSLRAIQQCLENYGAILQAWPELRACAARRCAQ
jgi:hypothetical protein